MEEKVKIKKSFLKKIILSVTFTIWNKCIDIYKAIKIFMQGIKLKEKL